MFTLTLTEDQMKVIFDALGNSHRAGEALTIQAVTNQYDEQKASADAEAVAQAQEVLAQVQDEAPADEAPEPAKKTKKSK